MRTARRRAALFTAASLTLGILAAPAAAVTRWQHQPPPHAPSGQDLRLVVVPPAECGSRGAARQGCAATRTALVRPGPDGSSVTVGVDTIDGVPTVLVVPSEQVGDGVFHYRLRTWEEHCATDPEVGGPFPGFRLSTSCRWIEGPVLPITGDWYRVRVGMELTVTGHRP